MNYRNRALLDLAYELECTIRLPDICRHERGEPAHANQAVWGKGGAMKAHDFAFAAACRTCHAEIDQGDRYSKDARQFYWLRGHVETMRQLWGRGLLCVTPNGSALRIICNNEAPKPAKPRKGGKRGSQCTASTKTVPRRFA